MEVRHLDRHAVKKLFGVGPRRARQFMAGLAGIRAGNAAAISRRALIARMDETAATPVPRGPRENRGREGLWTYLRIINQGVGPVYSIGVGPFYVVKATEEPDRSKLRY